jgi:hypothetical protein
MDNEKVHNDYLQNNQFSYDRDTPNNILKNNKKKNQEKLVFFKFLIYNTKIEIHLNQLQGYLYWVSILEMALWLVLLACFISSPSSMGINWLFIYHIARGCVGIFIMLRIPGTHEVIENLGEYENTPIEELQKSLEMKYANLVQQGEVALKTLLLVYLILTVVSLIIDFILLVTLAVQLSDLTVQYRNYVVLITLMLFISKDKF